MKNNSRNKTLRGLVIFSLISLTSLTILMTPLTIFTQQSYFRGAPQSMTLGIPSLSQQYGFATNGIEIYVGLGSQRNHQICSDGSGGAIIAWEDNRANSSQSDIYAQKVSSNGSIEWTTNGIEICTANSWQLQVQIISDNAGGAIIVWCDGREPVINFTSQYDIYAQRINSNGDIMWEPNGTAICSAEKHQNQPRIISDGMGGAIIAWQDYRTGQYD
ncbi:MAG: hypothetical protein ACXACX_19495, partial [Candidatus Hodarchaeales archaeon]